MADLHIRRWGNGTRVAVLIHGFTTDSTSWWQFGPALADRGYTVLAPDLPGHGYSPRSATYTVDTMATALTAALPEHPDLAVGHSLGGLLLARIEDDLAPERVVYADPAWSPGHPAVTESFRAQKNWSFEQVRTAMPRWAPEAQRGKLESLSRWDVATLSLMDGLPEFRPPAPRRSSLILLADPSRVVSPDKATELATLGFDVRTVEHAGHVIHNDDFPAFLAGLHDRIQPGDPATGPRETDRSAHADLPN